MSRTEWFDSMNETFDSSLLLITDAGPRALMHQRDPLNLKGQVFPVHIFALYTNVWIINGLKWCVFGVEVSCLSLQALFWGASFSGSSLSWLFVLCVNGSRGDHSRVRRWKRPRTQSASFPTWNCVHKCEKTTKNVTSSCHFWSRFMFCLLWILLNSCCKYSKHDPFIVTPVKQSLVVY